MNKSTPINQLPSQLSAPQNSFVNDQQRHMITQAQHAISTSQMPQNTQLAPEIMNEDDVAIQDMLNNLNTGGIQQQDQQQIPMHTQDELLQRLAANNVNVNSLMSGYGPQAYSMPQQQFASMPSVPTFSAKTITSLFQNELKLVGLVFLVVLLVQFVPFHQYVGKYFAIDKIPYHNVILRAIVASLLVVIGKKLLG